MPRGEDPGCPLCEGSDCEPCRLAASVCRVYMARFRLPAEDAADCEVAFLARLWRDGRCAIGPDAAGMCPLPLLRKCAHDWVCTEERRLKRQRGLETYWPGLQTPDGSRQPVELPDPSAGPETLCLKGEFWGRLFRALKELEPRQRYLIVRHCVGERHITEIAAAAGESTGATKAALYRALEHLAGILARHGMDEAEARSYLRTPPPAIDTRLPFAPG